MSSRSEVSSSVSLSTVEAVGTRSKRSRSAPVLASASSVPGSGTDTWIGVLPLIRLRSSTAALRASASGRPQTNDSVICS